MTDGQNEVASQNPSTIPKQPCDGTCGRHDDEEPPTLESENKQQALQAGEIVRDPLHPCCDCPVYQDGYLNTPICELCRTNPEPDANLEIERLAKWISETLAEIVVVDSDRRRDGLPMNDAAFLVRVAVAASDVNNDCCRLMWRLLPPDAETLSGELSVEHTLGGQTEDEQYARVLDARAKFEAIADRRNAAEGGQ